MKTLRLILGDQLTPSIATLDEADRQHDIILMAELADETAYVPHHKQKIAFILSAMRHFADELRGDGWRVDYVRLDDPANSGSFDGEVQRAVQRHGARGVQVTEPGEWRVRQMIDGWADTLGLRVRVRCV